MCVEWRIYRKSYFYFLVDPNDLSKNENTTWNMFFLINWMTIDKINFLFSFCFASSLILMPQLPTAYTLFSFFFSSACHTLILVQLYFYIEVSKFVVCFTVDRHQVYWFIMVNIGLRVCDHYALLNGHWYGASVALLSTQSNLVPFFSTAS